MGEMSITVTRVFPIPCYTQAFYAACGASHFDHGLLTPDHRTEVSALNRCSAQLNLRPPLVSAHRPRPRGPTVQRSSAAAAGTCPQGIPVISR